MPGMLSPDVVEPLLRGRFGRPFVYAARCDSTQRVLDDRLPEGALAVCDEQSAGRGRLGRSWSAPAGTAILCSLLLRPPASRAIPELTLVAGLATAVTVERALGRTTGIKWPNDVLVDGRKVAGSLAETRGEAVVLGIGLNVNQSSGDLPATTLTRTASLYTVDGRSRERAPLLAGLLTELETQYDRWIADGLGELVEAIAERDVLLGRRISVGETTGVAGGIAPDGRLVLETSQGRRLVASGEATLAW
jgi:BirA family transcriptional regulator, biotin operon repressor / biotin---[acetyl-CoA-carboxylase] ligase